MVVDVLDGRTRRRRVRLMRAGAASVQRQRAGVDAVLDMQHRAGNRATGAWLDLFVQRQPDDNERGGRTLTVSGVGEFEVLSFRVDRARVGSRERDAPEIRELRVVLRGKQLARLQEAARQGRQLGTVVLRAGNLTVTVTVTDAVVSSISVPADRGDSGGPVAEVAFDGDVTTDVTPSRDDASGVDE